MRFGLCSCGQCPASRPTPTAGAGEAERGRSAGRGTHPALAFRPVCQLPQLTYIFRRLGNFLKTPVASRTDISLSFSRLRGKQADETAA